jgi:glycosyltransferase involved in cell wall biosynthesis
VHPFVSQSRLAEIYNACDIGVWPKQESTSQLDAAACGLPLVLDAAVEDKWRTDNSGLTYAGGAEGLAACLLRLESREYREKLGEHGRRKIAEAYSWDKLAADKLKDFTQALAAGAPVHG